MLIMLVFFLSCSDDEKENKPREWNIQGKVEKGPFVKGSNVDIQELNESLSPTGRSFTTTIIDDEGNFSLNNITLESPYVLLKANGYFFNEINGDLSQGEITLQSLANLNDGSSININPLTHLKKDRLIQLITQDHLSYKEANTKAQTEILTGFGLQQYANKDVNTYSITSGNDDSGVLITVSASLLNGRTEAQFTEFMAGLVNDFKSDGKLSEENRGIYWKNSTELNRFSLSNNIVKRYKSLNKDVQVPDLSRYIDWDNDGIAGNEFGNADLYFEIDTLKVGTEGGKFKIKINGSAKYKFPMDQMTEESIGWGAEMPVFTKSLPNDRYLELNVEPVKTIATLPASVTIISYDGQKTATLHIVQEGDYNKETANDKVKMLYTNILDGLLTSSDFLYTMEAFYSQTFNNYDSRWEDFYNHTLEPFNSTIQKGWELPYRPLNMFRFLKRGASEDKSELGQAVFAYLEAITYYHMAILWGNVPYVKNDNIDDPNRVIQLNEKDLFALFENQLQKAIELFPAKKNNNWIFVSKDTPRAILAKMYMQTGEYAKALTLFNDIISNGDYSVASSWKNASNTNSSELIFSLPQNKENEYTSVILNGERLPLITYTEVLLSAAECEIQQGNRNKALDYLNSVRSKRGKANANLSDLDSALEVTWKEELKGYFSYFAYLKRNGLAENKLQIESYQKILPIPRIELDRDPSIKQNPGYKL